MSLVELEQAAEYLQSLGGRDTLNQGAISASLALVRARIHEIQQGGTGGTVAGVQAEVPKIH